MMELWIVGWLNTSWPATGGVDDLASFASDSPSLMEIRLLRSLHYYYTTRSAKAHAMLL